MEYIVNWQIDFGFSSEAMSSKFVVSGTLPLPSVALNEHNRQRTKKLYRWLPFRGHASTIAATAKIQSRRTKQMPISSTNLMLNPIFAISFGFTRNAFHRYGCCCCWEGTQDTTHPPALVSISSQYRAVSWVRRSPIYKSMWVRESHATQTTIYIVHGPFHLWMSSLKPTPPHPLILIPTIKPFSFTTPSIHRLHRSYNGAIHNFERFLSSSCRVVFCSLSSQNNNIISCVRFDRSPVAHCGYSRAA